MDRLAANITSMLSVSVMYNTERRSTGSLCQYKALGREFGYKQGIRKMLKTRINVELQNEQFDKFIKMRPDPVPKIKISIKLDIPSYKSHSPPLQVKYSKDYVRFLSKSTIITPFITASTAKAAVKNYERKSYALIFKFNFSHNFHFGECYPCQGPYHDDPRP